MLNLLCRERRESEEIGGQAVLGGFGPVGADPLAQRSGAGGTIEKATALRVAIEGGQLHSAHFIVDSCGHTTSNGAAKASPNLSRNFQVFARAHPHKTTLNRQSVEINQSSSSSTSPVALAALSISPCSRMANQLSYSPDSSTTG